MRTVNLKTIALQSFLKIYSAHARRSKELNCNKAIKHIKWTLAENIERKMMQVDKMHEVRVMWSARTKWLIFTIFHI